MVNVRNQWKTLKIVHAIVLRHRYNHRYNHWCNQRRKSCSQQRELPQWLVQAMRKTYLNWFRKHCWRWVVANLRATSDNDELNATKVELERQKCAEIFKAGNNSCFSCADMIGCGFCAGEGSCLPGDNNGPFYRNCSKGWHDASFTCEDNPNANEIKVIPVTTIQDDMSPSATDRWRLAISQLPMARRRKNAVVAAPSGPAKGEKKGA